MNGLLDLAGKTAIVTGGARGVGKATALLLAEAGVSVGIGFRSREEEARATVREMEAWGVNAWAQAGDLGNPKEARALFRSHVDEAQLSKEPHRECSTTPSPLSTSAASTHT